MVDATEQATQHETPYETKRVFMRAEHKDEIEVWRPGSSRESDDPLDTAIVVKRSLTYYGPKLRMDSNDGRDQYLLTAPGPQSRALMWELKDDGWVKKCYVELNFTENLPQYDICLHCNEPLKTTAHRRRAAVGGCLTDD